MEYSDNAKKIYENLYLARNNKDEITENIYMCHQRVAKSLAVNKEEEKEFLTLLNEKKFRPNTPVMLNAGINPDLSLFACFILDLEDSMESIIEMWATVAKIYSGGGGAGIPITNLRGAGENISTGGQASGPVSYSRVVQSISDQVRSGGRGRRAANLLSFWYKHKDIFDLIKMKDGNNDFSAINISVLLDNAFFVSPLKEDEELLDEIARQAWRTGDPGLLFYNAINEKNPFPSMGDIICGNPCTEIVLPPWSACNLGSMNLNRYCGETAFDISEFGKDIDVAVRFLNRVIDKSSYPNSKFKDMMKKTRPIGLGLMGFADLLYRLRIPYNSQEARDLFSQITMILTKKAYKSSVRLAQKEGRTVSCPEMDKTHFLSLQNSFGIENPTLEIANSTVTCLPPTGSTAISADCSYSFEPQMALVWTKKLTDSSDTLIFVNEYFLDYCAEHGIGIDENIKERIRDNMGSIQGMDDVFPKECQEIFVTAHDIHWKDRIEMQAEGQKNITMAISSTINLPNSSTEKDIKNAYLYAWKKGLKGITVYRDGSREEQPVNFGNKVETTIENFDHTYVQERPQELFGRTVKMKTGSGELFLTINELNGVPFEVFATIGKGGRSMAAKAEAIGRLVSLCLRAGINVEQIVKQLEGIGGDYQIFQEGRLIKSIPDAIANVLKTYKDEKPNDGKWNEDPAMEELLQDIADMKETIKNPVGYSPESICPQCGQPTLKRDMGCRGGICVNPDCGFSNCS